MSTGNVAGKNAGAESDLSAAICVCSISWIQRAV